MENRILLNLIKDFRSRDIQAFPLICNEFQGLINFYSFKTDDEDLYQDLTVFLLELLYGIKLDNFKEDSSDTLKRYIAVCLRNKYISYSKNKEKEKKLLIEYCKLNIGYSKANTDEFWLKDFIKTLSDKQRMIIDYRYIYGYSDEEISRICNTSRQAVCRIRCKGLNKLRKFYL